MLKCDGADLYWINRSAGDLYSARIDGSNMRTVSAGTLKSAVDAEIVGSHAVLALNGDAPKIVRVPLAGGAPEVVSTNVTSTYQGIDSHNGAVYWFDGKQIAGPSGTIHTESVSIVDMAVDDTGVYYASGNDLMVVPTSGGTPRRLARSDYPPRVVELDPEHVVYGTDTTIMRITRGIGFPEPISSTTASAIYVHNGTYAWMGSLKVYVKERDVDTRLLAPYNGIGGIAICAGFVVWASSVDGIIVRAALYGS